MEGLASGDVSVTTIEQTTAVAAGWYADPQDAARIRYWDGASWTADVAPLPEVATPSTTEPSSTTDGVPLSRRQLRERTGPLVNGEPDEVPVPAAASVRPPESAPAPSQDLDSRLLNAPPPSVTPAEPVSAESDAVDPAPVTIPKPYPPVTTSAHGGSPDRPWAGAPPPMVPRAQAGPVSLAPHEITNTGLTDFSAARQGYVPMSRLSADSMAVANLTIATKPLGLPVWLLAVVPVIQVAVIFVVFVVLKFEGPFWLGYVILGAPLVFNLLLASIDSRMLRSNGHGRVAGAGWAVVPPLYLLLRCTRVGAISVWPLLAWILLQTAAAGFLLLHIPQFIDSFTPAVAHSTSTSATPDNSAAPLTDAQRANELTPIGMAAAVKSQLKAAHTNFTTVVCPPVTSTDDGTQITCVGTLATVTVNILIVLDSTQSNSVFVVLSQTPVMG